MSSISIEQVRSVAELAEHAEAWDRLALAAPEQLPMLSYPWVATFLEHQLEPRSTWRCLFAYDGQDLVGVLPIIRSHRLFGIRLDAPFDLHTRSGYALLAAGRENDALAAMLQSLTVLEPRYVSMRFHGLRSGSVSLHARPGTNARAVALSSFGGNGSVISTRGSFVDYENGLSSNFRRNLRKAHNRCLRDYQTDFDVYTGTDATPEQMFRRFLDVEAAGYKGAAGTAIKCQPNLVNFYSALAQRLAQRGWLEWHFLELDGEPAAGHLAVLFGRSLVLQKIGYNENYARLGPGNLLFHHIVARAFANDDIDEINCLTDLPWHANWDVTKDDYTDLMFTPRRILPMARGKLEVELPAAAIRRAKETPWLVGLVRKAKTMRCAPMTASRRHGSPLSE